MKIKPRLTATPIDLDHSRGCDVRLSEAERTRTRGVMMTKPIPDKAEVALELPDKLYIGTFERSARFDAHLDQAGVSLTLHRLGDADTRKSVRMHFHYGLFADVLNDLARTVSAMPSDDADHREALRKAAEALYRALSPKKKSKADADRETSSKTSDDASGMTPEEEVLLLHVME
jgi:hypothetical protein